jgi:hypothetical protein
MPVKITRIKTRSNQMELQVIAKVREYEDCECSYPESFMQNIAEDIASIKPSNHVRPDLMYKLTHDQAARCINLHHHSITAAPRHVLQINY